MSGSTAPRRISSSSGGLHLIASAISARIRGEFLRVALCIVILASIAKASEEGLCQHGCGRGAPWAGAEVGCRIGFSGSDFNSV